MKRACCCRNTTLHENQDMRVARLNRGGPSDNVKTNYLRMKKILTLIFLVLGNHLFSQNLQDEIQTKTQLSQVYFNTGEFDKAAPLMFDLYQITKNSYYFEKYVDCLVEQQKFDEAENLVKKEYNKPNGKRPDLMVVWGYILKRQKKESEATEKYKEAISKLPLSKAYFINLANTFTNRREFEWAEKTYLRGKELMPQENFSFELATINIYLRNYDRMIEEFLNTIKNDESQLPMVQSYLASALQLDINNELKEKFRTILLRRIQAEPSVLAYNRLLIWFFLQERKFPQALRQSIALDKRTGTEDGQIISLGFSAVNNDQYSDAREAFGYILSKGEKNQYYWTAYTKNLNCSFLKLTKESPFNIAEGKKLAEWYEKAFSYMGYNYGSSMLMVEYAHLQAFYLNQQEKALDVLQKGISSPRLPVEIIGQLKAEMADIYVYNNDPWEATLIYSQVIDDNKNNSLGDEVKLKKAKLAWYLGNFDWAKAQLDVIKASTSKLTANDAMELSLLIGNNLNLDTTAVPLQMFARGDYHFFRNKDSLAIAVYDSIAEFYPYHTLMDDIYFRKAKIAVAKNRYNEAVGYLEKIVSEFNYESLVDDALIMLAGIYEEKLFNKDKAMEMYIRLIENYPGSLFVDEARQKYRQLREQGNAHVPENKI